MPDNPFTTEYVRREVAWLNVPPFEQDGIRVVSASPQGRVDSYLNKEFAVGDYECPILLIDGETWMSLTKMEVESAWVPIQYAHLGGIIGTAGLGLGYFALRAASHPDVERVDVYELDPRVIDLFNNLFADRPEAKKIRIIPGDARELVRDKEYDYFFADIYETLLPDAVISDIDLFCGNNDFGQFTFWGWERVLYSYMQHADGDEDAERFTHVFLGGTMREFFRYWMEDEDRTALVNWPADEEYTLKVFDAMENWMMV